MLPVAYHCIVVYDDLVIALDGDVLDGVHLVCWQSAPVPGDQGKYVQLHLELNGMFPNNLFFSIFSIIQVDPICLPERLLIPC